MDFELQLQLFCLSNDFDECIMNLKNKITKKSQMETYDSIYDDFVRNNSLEDFNEDVIIPNLHIMIRLMIFCQIYRKQLFPGIFEDFEPTPDQLEKFEMLFNITNFSVSSFIDTSSILCSIYDDEYFTNGVKLPKKRFCFPYILLHKAGNLSFESLSNMIFEGQYSKLPISFKFMNDNTGPHGGFFEFPFMFFDHDYDHFCSTIKNIGSYDIDPILNLFRETVKGTLKRRFVEIFSHIMFFENRRTLNNPNIFRLFSKLGKLIINIFDKNDVDYVFKYIIESNNLDSYCNVEELRTQFLIYKHEYDRLKFFLKEIILDDMNLDRYGTAIKYEKYSGIISIDSPVTHSTVNEKLETEANRINDNFLNNVIKPLFLIILEEFDIDYIGDEDLDEFEN